MPQLVQSSAWIVPAVLLFVVAWARFNSPPTNRSGTTFAMFFFGMIFYYALILALWLLVIIAVSQGSIGFDKFSIWLGQANPEAQGKFAQFSPIVAALIIVVAAQFRWVFRIDTAARAFCVKLAAIPREADRLTLELAQNADFQPQTEGLRRKVIETISDNIGPEALNFNGDGTLPARFTRAVGLYWLFVGPNANGMKIEFANASRSAYARIMQFNETTASRADARYEELMHVGLAYFKTPQSKELKEALNRSIMEVSNLTCSLIARYVLSCDVTKSGRRQRLSAMGFDATRVIPSFGRDQWVSTILAVIVLAVGMMAFTPGTHPLPASKILMISITFGVSIGFAVMGAVYVARRFMERQEGEKSAYPPIADLTLAALIVAGLSVALRIGIPLVPALMQGGISGLPDVIAQFVERWPGIIIPFACTLSLGLLCCYLGARSWSWLSTAAVGALGNGIAFTAAAVLVAWMLEDNVLANFYVHPERARGTIVISTGLMGLLIGAIVLAQFNRSERARKDIAKRAVDSSHASSAGLYLEAPPEDLEPTISPKSGTAGRNFGGYFRSNVLELEGRYVCLRPAFTSAGIITAYLMVLRWDDAETCLTFEEEGRADAGHTQRGRVYIPDGRPFISFVTVERGAIRLITVSRPEKQEPARGLIMTLSNPSGMQFTPASAPVVLRRVGNDLPQLGFISPGEPDYDAYCQELERVTPGFGFFAASPRSGLGIERLAKTAEDRLALVR